MKTANTVVAFTMACGLERRAEIIKDMQQRYNISVISAHVFDRQAMLIVDEEVVMSATPEPNKAVEIV